MKIETYKHSVLPADIILDLLNEFMQHDEALSLLQEVSSCATSAGAIYSFIVFLFVRLFSFLCHSHLYLLIETLMNSRVEDSRRGTHRRYEPNGFTRVS